jgi:hypothetical protein
VETKNYAPADILEQRIGLLRGYSTPVTKVEAYRDYRGQVRRVFSGDSRVKPADSVMIKWLHDNVDLIREPFASKAFSMLDTLKSQGYGFKKEVKMVQEAVDRFSDVHAYNAINRPGYREVLDYVRRKDKPGFPLFQLEAPNLEEFKDFFSNMKANAGFLGCYTGRRHKGDMMTEEMRRMVYKLEGELVNGGFETEPTLPGLRLQLSIPVDDDGEVIWTVGDDGTRHVVFKQKTRLVNMESALLEFLQGHFMREIQRAMNTMSWYAAGKKPEALYQYVMKLKREYAHITTIDYSSYDQTMPGWLLRDVYSIWHDWFPRWNESWEKRWNAMTKACINGLIVCDRSGTLRPIRDGNRSGLKDTNAKGSMAGRIIALYYLIHILHWTEGRDFNIAICGDDLLIASKREFSLSDYANFVRKVFGVICRPEKCGHWTGSDKKRVNFLSREWRDGGIWRNPWHLIVKLVYHERWRNYEGDMSPEMMIHAYNLCYPLGMGEWIDQEAFYRRYPSARNGAISKEVASQIGGLVEYETKYGTLAS